MNTCSRWRGCESTSPTRWSKRSRSVASKRELTWVARLAPYYVEGLVALAGIAAETGDFAEANARVAQALALAPHDRGALALAAKLTAGTAPRR